eukprot:TRINITY_DN14645_c0_g1_i1.p1 TRINITY_DN14645_c0_g1~~TRINITY_DN14645_c0_g1_i1.p1  ORF type:complete len:284 (+),score=54.67 TRINITY_DN14645_c0_g1_i1:45-854(+)
MDAEIGELVKSLNEHNHYLNEIENLLLYFPETSSLIQDHWNDKLQTEKSKTDLKKPKLDHPDIKKRAKSAGRRKRAKDPSFSPVISSSRISPAQTKQLRSLLPTLGGRLVDDDLDRTVTHLIMGQENGVSHRTMKYFAGILYGIWIVSFDWVKESSVFGCWIEEGDYEIRIDTYGKAPGPMLGRLSQVSEKENDILEGYHIYVKDFPALQELIPLTGAKLLPSPPKDPDPKSKHIILCHNSKVSGGISTTWLFDCLSTYRAIPTNGYIL